MVLTTDGAGALIGRGTYDASEADGSAGDTMARARSRRAGQPPGSSAFLDRVEATLARDPRPGKLGPKAKRGSELSALSP